MENRQREKEKGKKKEGRGKRGGGDCNGKQKMATRLIVV